MNTSGYTYAFITKYFSGAFFLGAFITKLITCTLLIYSKTLPQNFQNIAYEVARKQKRKPAKCNN